MSDLEERLDNRVQLTTDGRKVYLTAVEAAFAGGVDYGHAGEGLRRGAGRGGPLQPGQVHRR